MHFQLISSLYIFSMWEIQKKKNSYFLIYLWRFILSCKFNICPSVCYVYYCLLFLVYINETYIASMLFGIFFFYNPDLAFLSNLSWHNSRQIRVIPSSLLIQTQFYHGSGCICSGAHSITAPPPNHLHISYLCIQETSFKTVLTQIGQIKFVVFVISNGSQTFLSLLLAFQNRHLFVFFGGTFFFFFFIHLVQCCGYTFTFISHIYKNVYCKVISGKMRINIFLFPQVENFYLFR